MHLARLGLLGLALSFCSVQGCGGRNPNQGLFILEASDLGWFALGGFYRYDGDLRYWTFTHFEGPCALASSALPNTPSEPDPVEWGPVSVEGARTLALPAEGRDQPPWAPGDTVTLRGQGSAAVPPFVVQVQTPGPVAVAPFPANWPRSQDLPLEWAQGATTMYFEVSGTLAEPRTDRMIPRGLTALCELPASPGRGALPSSLLQRFEPGRKIQIRIHARNRTTRAIGAWSVEFETRTGVGVRTMYLD